MDKETRDGILEAVEKSKNFLRKMNKIDPETNAQAAAQSFLEMVGKEDLTEIDKLIITTLVVQIGKESDTTPTVNAINVLGVLKEIIGLLDGNSMPFFVREYIERCKDFGMMSGVSTDMESEEACDDEEEVESDGGVSQNVADRDDEDDDETDEEDGEEDGPILPKDLDKLIDILKEIKNNGGRE